MTSRGPSGKLAGVVPNARPLGGDLFRNPVFLSALFSLLVAQFLKSVIGILRSRSKSFREVLSTFLWKTGGMPSSHSALAISIATSIAYIEGLDTTLFALSLVFALAISSIGSLGVGSTVRTSRSC